MKISLNPAFLRSTVFDTVSGGVIFTNIMNVHASYSFEISLYSLKINVNISDSFVSSKPKRINDPSIPKHIFAPSVNIGEYNGKPFAITKY